MDTREKENIVQEYLDSKKTIPQLAKEYHHSNQSIINVLDEYNIDHSRKTRASHSGGKRRILTLEEEEIVCQVYKETGSAAKCCEAIHSGQDVVRRCLQKYGLYRTLQQAMQNRLPKYPINESFFEVQSHDMIYLLGFLAADGTVRKDQNEIKLTLAAVDAIFLEYWQNRLGGRPIKTYETQDGYKNSTWEFTSKKVKRILSEYNIVPNKTFSFTFPSKIEKEFYRDFIRGYFDGDGSVSTAGKSAIRWQLCSATKDVLQKTIDYFAEFGIPKPEIYTTHKRNTLYYIQYSSVPTRKIYDILYYDNCVCLPRKRDKYLSII